MPEVKFTGPGIRVRRNPFAARIAREGIQFVATSPAGMKAVRAREPSRASLREMPEGNLSKARRSPFAKRIADQGGVLSLQVGRGRPKRGAETGPTVPKSIRLPEQVWARLTERAKQEGVPLHAILRAAIVDWLNRAA